MPKNTPEVRWQKHIIERYVAFKLSEEFKSMRAEGLKILGRKRLYTPEEWNATFHQRAISSDFRQWWEKCKKLGDRFGLAQWTVELGCLLKGYKPDGLLVAESDWPRVRIVTENTDPVFLQRLMYEAQCFGLHVIQKQGQIENLQILANPVTILSSEPPPLPSSKPPLYGAFRLRFETPIGYPPEATAQLGKQANHVANEILRRLGYLVPQRLRTSNLVAKAEDYKVGKPLESGGIYNIMGDSNGDDLSRDQERRKRIKDRRHKLKKRLIDPYNQNHTKSNATRLIN